MWNHSLIFWGMAVAVGIVAPIFLTILNKIRWKSNASGGWRSLMKTAASWIYGSFILSRPALYGQSITEINAEINNLIRKRLRVVVRPGTYFVAKGIHQNMAACKQCGFMLEPVGRQRIQIPAACINAHSPVPHDRDEFNGVAMASRFRRFLEKTQSQDPMVVQAGVWAITDCLTSKEIEDKLVIRTALNAKPAISFLADHNGQKHSKRIEN